MVRSAILIFFAVLQIVAALRPEFFGIEGTIGATAERNSTNVVPAGYAFAIWSILFAGGLYVATWHAARPASPLRRRLGWFAAAAFAGNAVWALHQPVFGPGLVSALLLVPILAFAYLAAWQGRRDPSATAWDRAAYASLWALAGWLTAALAAGLSVALLRGGLWPFVGSSQQSAYALLLAWAPLAVLLTYRSGAVAFALAIAWGLAGIGVRSPELSLFTGVLALAVIGASFAGKRS